MGDYFHSVMTPICSGGSLPSDREFSMMSRLLKAILISIDRGSSERLNIFIRLEEK